MNTRIGALVLYVLIAGCGGSGSQAPKPISGPAKQVAEAVEQLGRATATRDFRAVCRHLLAAATLRQAGGRDCPAVLAERARGVAHPRLVIKSIDLAGSQALVKVKTTAEGQAATDDVIRLVLERGRYRISSLGR